jgi:nucleotide-binding universal stress UspA family protein
MNARGSTEVIVASIGLSMGVLNQNLFTLIVTMAVVTTMAMPAMLRWSLKRLPMRKKERVRLEREELDARGFVPNLERLLLAADDSANGKFASQLAGAIAGSGGKPTTVVNMTKDDRNQKTAKAEAGKADDKADAKPAAKPNGKESHEEVKDAAEATTTLEAHPDEEKPGKVDVTTRADQRRGPEAVAGEARKGYDFLIVGIARTRNPKGGFSKDISVITREYEGPLAVADAHESDGKRPPRRYGKILIPVNGSDVSRRAAEVGLTLARAGDAQVTALYVTRVNGSGGSGKSASRKRAARRNEQAVLKDIAALADRYEVDVRSTTLVNLAPEEAILKESKRGYDLIVLGVSRRPGETLFFGNTAASVLDRSNTANLFVAS